MPRHHANPLERRAFPRVPVFTRFRVKLRHRDDYLTADMGDVSTGGMRVIVERPWDVGLILDVEFRLLDEARPYVGLAEVMWAREETIGEQLSWAMGLRFIHVTQRSDGWRSVLRQAVYTQGQNLADAVAALRYAWGELHGNVTMRELGQPGAGFKRPVLLVHGWLGTRGVLTYLESSLKRAGYPVFSVDLGLLNIHDIERSGKLIRDKVAALSERLGLPRITVLAHSMGGLIALWGIKKLDLARYVDRLITVGTPFHGTYWTLPGMMVFSPLVRTLWQMRPGSAFLNRLHEGPLPDDVEIYCIAGRHDLFVAPPSATLAGAINIMIDGGHASLIAGRPAVNKITSLLETRNPLQVARD